MVHLVRTLPPLLPLCISLCPIIWGRIGEEPPGVPPRIWPLPSQVEQGSLSCRISDTLEVEWVSRSYHQPAASEDPKWSGGKWQGNEGEKAVARFTASLLRAHEYATRHNAIGCSDMEETCTNCAVEKLRVDAPHQLRSSSVMEDEEYVLTSFTSSPPLPHQSTEKEWEISATVSIKAGSVIGLLHALESLRQLISSTGKDSLVLNSVPFTISDSPRFSHRGVLIDTSRNFLGVAVLKDIVEAMAMNKLNVLHWHAVDAQSFPLNLPSAPFLAQYGAYSEGEQYSATDVRELVEFARERGVRVIAEMDMPGHAYSWGLDANHSALTVCGGRMPWELFCSEPPCGQLDPTVESTFEVVRSVIEDVAHLFPDPYIHLGADEVNYRCWAQDHGLTARMTRKDQTFKDLWQEFEDRSLQMVRDKEKLPILWQDAWDEGLDLPKETILQVWKGSEDVARITAEGYQVIVSSADGWYLDCGSGSFIDGGRSWCDPFKSWEAIYSVDPTENLDPASSLLVLGGEVCLWGEQVDETNVHSKLWPRAAAFAERTWSLQRPSDLKDAKKSLDGHRERMRSRGIATAPLHPRYCTLNPGMCDSNSGGPRHLTSYGITDFPSSATKTFHDSMAEVPASH